MDPTNQPFRKENELPNLHHYVQNVNLSSGVISLMIFSKSSKHILPNDWWCFHGDDCTIVSSVKIRKISPHRKVTSWSSPLVSKVVSLMVMESMVKIP